MKRLKKTGWLWASLACILLAGTYLRLVGLADTDYNPVEIATVYQAHENYLGEDSSFLSPDDLQDIVFSRIIQYSYTVFGENELATRSINVVVGGMLIVMMFFIGWRFFHKGNAGIIAAFITAFHPLLIDFSRIATVHNSRFFALTFLVYAFYEGIEGTREKHLGLLADNAKLKKLFVFWNLDWFWLAIAIFTLWTVRLVVPHIEMLLFGLAAYCIVLFIMQFIHTVPRAGLKWKYGILLVLILGALVALRMNVVETVNADALQNIFAAEAAIDAIFLNPSNWTLTAFALIGSIFSIVNLHKAGFYTLTIFIASLIIARLQGSIADYFFVFPLYLVLATYGVFEFAYYIRRQLDVQLINVDFEKRLHITPQRLIMGFFLAAVILVSPWFRETLDGRPKKDMLAGHVKLVEWKQIGAFLKQNQNDDQPVISMNPLLSRYYGFKGTYFQIDVDSFAISTENAQPDFQEELIIHSLKDFSRVVKEYESGWLVLEHSLKSENLILRLSQGKALNFKLEKRFTPPENTAMVYYWNVSENQNGYEN